MSLGPLVDKIITSIPLSHCPCVPSSLHPFALCSVVPLSLCYFVLCMSVQLSVYPFVYLSLRRQGNNFHPLVLLFLRSFVPSSLCRFVLLSLCPFVTLSFVFRSIYQFIPLYLCPLEGKVMISICM